jgi:hypothetical protein
MYIQTRLASSDRALRSRCGFFLGEDSLPTIERADDRRHYGETRIRAIGVVGNLALLASPSSIACASLLAELAARPRPSEEEIGPTRSWLAASRYIRRHRRTGFAPCGRGRAFGRP